MRVVINTCFGGFGLSRDAIRAYLERKGKKAFFYVHPEKDHSMKRFVRAPARDDGRLSFTLTRDLGESIVVDSLPNEDDLWFYDRDVERHDPDLVAVVEELGPEKASGRFAQLKVVDVPDGIEYVIEEYDGREHIAERHRTWG